MNYINVSEEFGKLMQFVFATFMIIGLIFTELPSTEVVWRGFVSTGKPTEDIELELCQKYQFRVRGSMKFLSYGRRNGIPQFYDACYKFSMRSDPVRFLSFENSLNIPMDDYQYNPDHVYLSKSFFPMQEKVRFWICEDEYNDDIDSLEVEIIRLDIIGRKKGANLYHFCD